MKLIATLGATPSKHKHTYLMGESRYETYFSFEAVKLYYDIPDKNVYIIGTKETQKVLGSHIGTYRFIEVDPNDLDEIFAKSIEVIDSETILDLTQSFRSIPFGVFLSLGFSKTLNKRSKEIYYAQTIDPACNPMQAACSFRFVSLKRYDEIGELARTINTFLHTLITIENNIEDIKFQTIYRQLQAVSKAFFDNNYIKLFDSAGQLSKTIASYRDDADFDYLKAHLRQLEAEIGRIESFKSKYESETLLHCSEYLLEKKIYLHAVTTLYESMVAFLDEELSPSGCDTTEDNRTGKMRKANTYERRNCLKKSLKNCDKVKKIPDCHSFSKYLKNIDKLRNISAHAFTSDKTDKNLATEIEKTIRFLEETYKKRLSKKSTVDRLKEAFS